MPDKRKSQHTRAHTLTRTVMTGSINCCRKTKTKCDGNDIDIAIDIAPLWLCLCSCCAAVGGIARWEGGNFRYIARHMQQGRMGQRSNSELQLVDCRVDKQSINFKVTINTQYGQAKFRNYRSAITN